jgi:hypothetical protein
MANSVFPIKIGRRGTSNARILNALRSGRIPYAAGWRYWHDFRVQVGDFVGEGDTDQTIDLNVLYPTRAFPANVLRLSGAYVEITTGISGGSISDADLEVGDAGDPNGLLTITPAFTTNTGFFTTPAAAEYAARIETGFAPTLRVITTGGNASAITAMDVTVWIPFMPLPA